LELQKEGAIQNQAEQERQEIQKYLKSEENKFNKDPDRKSEHVKWQMTINDPDMLHSLINDPFESGIIVVNFKLIELKLRVQKTKKMVSTKQRPKDVFVDQKKKEAVERRESKMKFEERKRKLKDFFGFGKSSPVKMEQPISQPPLPVRDSNVRAINKRSSKMRIFDETPVTRTTPTFYQMNPYEETPKISPSPFHKKKAKPEEPKPREEEQENVGFLDRIKQYFTPKKPNSSNNIIPKNEDSYEEGGFAEEYMRSINQKKLNYDYSKPYANQPPNVNN
jgi:hypothetical protein